MKRLIHPRVLSIAGSDPSGGAGIQADLKTFSALRCYGMTAITAIVDENTVGVSGVHPVPIGFVEGQIRSCLDDIGADAVKIGMLHSSELIMAVDRALAPYGLRNIVFDPVMVATSGDPLLQPDAVETLRTVLIPKARVITPNIPEAEILSGRKIGSGDELPDVARELSQDGRVSVLLKAGHLEGDNEVADVFFNAEKGTTAIYRSPRIHTANTHGTGCTLSSAVAAHLARGFDLDSAIAAAKAYISGAIAAGAAFETGHGHGPVHHFFNLWQ